MITPRARIFFVALVATIAPTLGCTTDSRAEGPRRRRPPTVDLNPGSALRLSTGSRAAVLENRRLADRLRDSAYAFFRFQHAAFTARTCQLFARDRHVLPLVNLHGDAHVTQYATTQLGFGLDDFDEAGFGPAVVDLVRFGASLHLACREAGFACDPVPAIANFLTAYRTATIAPDTPLVVPTWVKRVRRREPTPRARYLDFAEGLMQPIADGTRVRLTRAWKQMARMLRATGFRAPTSFLRLERVGRIDVGIGSALVQKFLLRVRGPSDDPLDDRIIEVKAHSSADRTSCVFHPPTGGVLYPQVMQRRLGRVSPEVLAYLPNEGFVQAGDDTGMQMYWVHSWDSEYRELELEDLKSQKELEEIAADVGLQLGRGHCSHVTAPLEAQHRFAHAESIADLQERLPAAMALLAEETLRSWQAERDLLIAPRSAVRSDTEQGMLPRGSGSTSSR